MISQHVILKVLTQDKIITGTLNDTTLQNIIVSIKRNRRDKDPQLQPFFSTRNQLPLKNDMLPKDNCIIIPQQKVLEIVHSSHQGKTKQK